MELPQGIEPWLHGLEGRQRAIRTAAMRKAGFVGRLRFVWWRLRHRKVLDSYSVCASVGSDYHIVLMLVKLFSSIVLLSAHIFSSPSVVQPRCWHMRRTGGDWNTYHQRVAVLSLSGKAATAFSSRMASSVSIVSRISGACHCQLFDFTPSARNMGHCA